VHQHLGRAGQLLELRLTLSLNASEFSPSIEAEGVNFSYTPSEPILSSLSFAAYPASLTCIEGPSGVGKSTLLYALAGVLSVDGTVRMLGSLLPKGAGQGALIRLRSCGFVFQRGELLPELSVLDNVALPLRLLGEKRTAARSKAQNMLEQFGIANCAQRHAATISGGQAQRASLARALIHSPQIVFADEPTGSLDAVSRAAVLDALRGAAEDGACVIVATHDRELVNAADAHVVLRGKSDFSPAVEEINF